LYTLAGVTHDRKLTATSLNHSIVNRKVEKTSTTDLLLARLHIVYGAD